MISVLIPVFNTDVRPLVLSLKNQLEKAFLLFEIILIDDASISSYHELNKELAGFSCVTYERNEVNNGRVETRRKLAHHAKYEWLLFIDSDCLISNEHYVQGFKSLLNEDYDVILGGTSYAKDEPENCDFRLHWKYAKKRISTYTTLFKNNRYRGFLFNNVIIRKILFTQLSFPDSLKGYGHEDTWVGIQLEKEKARLIFLDNPILHPLLDHTAIFLQKNIEALHNIKALERITNKNTLKKHLKIYRYHYLLRITELVGLYNIILIANKRWMENNIMSCRPSLLYFDLLRLYHLNTILY